MAKTREFMDYLDEHIGIAPANSQEELQAAELVADIMGDHGLEPIIEEFDSRPLGQAMPYIIGLILFALVITQGLTSGVVHVVALVVALVLAALLIVRHFAFDLFENFGPPSGSQNVVAVHKAEGDKVVKGARTIVVVAHLDTPRESLLHGSLARLHAPLKQLFAPCSIVVAVTLLLQCLVFLPEALRTFAWIIGIIALVPMLVLSVVSLVDRHLPCTEGANDNKASIAALLSILSRVRPSEDRVSSGEAGAKPRRRLADETEEPVVSPKRVEVVEEVKGVRHGQAVLASLGILPATCEIIYEEPKVRIVEEVPEANPFTEGFGDEEEPGTLARVDEVTSDDEKPSLEEDGDTGDAASFDEDVADEEYGADAEEIEEYEEPGRVAAVGAWFANRFGSLRDRIAARRENAETDDEERPTRSRRTRRDDSEWVDDNEDEDSNLVESGHDDEDVDAEYDDYEGDEYDDEYDDDDYEGDEYDDEAYESEYDTEDEDDEREEQENEDEVVDEDDGLSPLSADMVGSGRLVLRAKASEQPQEESSSLDWEEEEEEESLYANEYADAEENVYDGADDYDDENDDAGEYEDDDEYDDDEEEYEDEYDDDEYDYEDEEYEESDEDDSYEDDYEDEPASDVVASRGARGASARTNDEWIDWDDDEEEEEEDVSDEDEIEEEAHEDDTPKGGFFARIKSFFSRPSATEADEYDEEDDEYDEYYEDEDDEYEDADYEEEEEPREEDERSDENESVDDSLEDEEPYDDDYYEDEWDSYEEDKREPANPDAAWEGEALEDDYDDYEYDDEDFDEEGDDYYYGDTSAEPLNEPLSDPNELHFDREEDDDILPRDASGLDTISDSYDLIDSAPEPQPIEAPTPIDDPNWGVSSFTPARPAVNIARRAALFDLPDPTFATPDPLRPEDDYEDEYDEYEDYEDDAEYYEYEDDDQPYDYEDEVDAGNRQATDDSARSDWKGGATLRSDLVDGGEPMVIDADNLQDAILEMGDDFLVAHDIWFVVTGASAADHSGMKAFIDEHRRDIRGAFLVNLDSIGSGTLGMYVQEGLRQPRRADRRLVRMNKTIAEDLHVDMETAAMTWDETEAATPMRSRLRAVTIVGLDDTNQPALSHTRDDVPDNVNPKQVLDVVRIVCELIRRS